MKRGTAILMMVAVTAVFAVFFVWPAAGVVGEAFRGADGGFTLRHLVEVLRIPVYVEGLRTSFLLGIASTLVTLAIAFPLALLGHRYDFAGRGLLGCLMLVPLVLPPFVGAVGIKQVLGTWGALNALLIDIGWMDPARPFDWLAHGRFWGIVVMNALHLYPILYLNIAAALSNLDPAMEQAAQNLGCPPWRRLWRITLPLAMPGVFAGSAIVFIWSFTELGVPLVFDYTRVAPVQVFDGIKDLGENPMPYALVAVLLLVSAAVFGASKLLLGRFPLGTQPRPKGRPAEVRLRGWRSWCCASVFLAVFLAGSLPHLGVILLSFSGDWYRTVWPELWTLRHYTEALGHPLVVPSIQNSLLYAGGATAAAMVLGVAIAWVVVRSDLKGRGWLDALVMSPLAVPGLVLAFGYLAMSQEGRPFHWLVGSGGSPVWLLVAAYAVRRLPYVVRAAVAGLQQANPAMEEAAWSLGATPWRALRRVSLPLIGTHLVAGGILAFAFSMLEVSDSLVLAQQAEHYPVTKAIYALLSMLGNGTQLAAALGVWSMMFLAVAIAGASVLGGKRGGMFRL